MNQAKIRSGVNNEVNDLDRLQLKDDESKKSASRLGLLIELKK